jgi:hypothetical protein
MVYNNSGTCAIQAGELHNVPARNKYKLIERTASIIAGYASGRYNGINSAGCSLRNIVDAGLGTARAD